MNERGFIQSAIAKQALRATARVRERGEEVRGGESVAFALGKCLRAFDDLSELRVPSLDHPTFFASIAEAGQKSDVLSPTQSDPALLRSRERIIIDPSVMARNADPTAKIALLRAAEEVFAEKGVDHAKVEDIARAAGISKGAFYLHFESKEEVLRQVVESFLGRMAAQLTLPMDLVPETPEELLQFWLERDRQAFDFLWQSRAILGILQTCAGDYMYLLDAFRGECRSSSVRWIEVLKERGMVRKDAHAEISAMIMNGAYSELVFKLLSEKARPDFIPWLRVSRELFVRGIGSARLISALERERQSPRVRIGIHATAKAVRSRRTGKRSAEEVQR